MEKARVGVAASGGRDSSALLHCTLRMAREMSGIEVVALHVHHGLMPAADDWLARVRVQARRWGAGFASHRVEGSPPRGASVEAWARDVRYGALAAMARDAGCPLVLLAHHRRDQAETFLLQALRGAGVAGLSAMPRSAERRGIVWARPWLDLPRSAIDAYVARHRIHVVDDPSNADPRYARSRLRTSLWPALGAAFPQAEAALAAAAMRAQQAAALADEVAAADLAPLVRGPPSCALDIARWRALSPARRANALRAWLAQGLGAPPPAALLRRLADELPAATAARWPAPGARELRLYRGALALQQAQPHAPARSDTAVDLGRPGCVDLPDWGGHYRVDPVATGGIARERLARACVRGRAGGERLRLRAGGPSRSLKQHWQAAGVPAWARSAPLLFDAEDGVLLHVAGIGADAASLAAPGQPQLRVVWVPGGESGEDTR